MEEEGNFAVGDLFLRERPRLIIAVTAAMLLTRSGGDVSDRNLFFFSFFCHAWVGVFAFSADVQR